MPQALSTVRSEQPVAVWLGATFATLAERTDVYARSVRRALSPGSDQAELVSDYGRLARHAAPWATVAPITLRDQCCEVRLDPTGTGTWVTVFQGLVTADVLQPAGTFSWVNNTQIPNGQVRHTCRGLDWLLDRISPHQSVSANHGNVGELFAFNGRGSPPERNCSIAKTTDGSGTSRVFDWGVGRGLWNSRDILEYVLRFATANSGYTWTLAGAYTALDAVTPQIEQRGRTLRQILLDCVRAQDGFAWRLAVAGTAVTVTIVSLTDTAVTDLDGGTAIPANADTFSLNSSLDTDRDIVAPVVTPVAESAYQRVEVVSEPIRVVAQLGRETSPGASDGFVPAWTVAQEAAFAAATDQARSEDYHRECYASYKLPDDWTGQDWLGNYVIPAWNPDTGVLTWPSSPTGFAPPALLFERTLPHAATGVEDTDQSEALLLLWNGTTWVQPERDSGNKGRCTVGARVSDSGPGVFLRTAHPSQLAPPGWGGTSEYSRDWNPYTDGLLLTVSFYSQTMLAVRHTAATGSGTKRIYAPGYHLWVCPYAATWSPGFAITAGTVLRDDRAALKRLAAQLSHWYTRTRNTLQYSAAVAPSQVNLGRVCTAMMTATGVTIIGTPVTSESWEWDDSGRFAYSMGTDFADLYLAAVSRRRVELGEREVHRRVRRVEERVAALPLRDPAAPAATLRPNISWGGTAWTISAAHWALPTGMAWYDAGASALTIPAAVTGCGVWVQCAKTTKNGVSGTHVALRLVSEATGASFRVAGSGSTSHLSPWLYVKIGALSCDSGTGVCRFTPDGDNTGPASLCRLFAACGLAVSFDIKPNASTDGIAFTHGSTTTTLTKASLGAGGLTYFCWRPATADWGTGIPPTSDPLCSIYWDGGYAPYSIDHANWLIGGTGGWSGTLLDGTGGTIGVTAGRVTFFTPFTP